MYDRIELPRTGRWARHLLRLAATSNVEVDPQLQEIAKETSYDPLCAPKGFSWSKREFNALQYVLDWNGRCILAYEKSAPGYAKHVALIAAKQLGSKRVMITTQRDVGFQEYIGIIPQLFPDHALAYSDAKSGDLIYAHGDETYEHQWFVHQARGLSTNSKTIDTTKPDHHIADLDSVTQIEYTFVELFKALCGEFSRTTVLVGCQEFWNTTMEQHVVASKAHITHILDDYLGLSSFHARVPHVSHTSKTPLQYYRARGVRMDSIAFYEASGACFSLVADKPTKFFRNVISSGLIGNTSDRSSRRAEMFQRYQQNEAQQCERLGKTLEQVVDSALDGNKESREALNAMQSEKWAKLKASALYSVIRDTVTTEEKTLIVAANPVIVRNLSAQTGATVYDSAGASSLQQTMMSNFVYPHPNASQFNRPANDKTFNRIKTLLIENILDVDERVLEATDRLVIAEFPYDREIMQAYVDLAQVFRFRMFFATMRGTFEDYLSEQLVAPYI